MEKLKGIKRVVKNESNKKTKINYEKKGGVRIIKRKKINVNE